MKPGPGDALTRLAQSLLDHPANEDLRRLARKPGAAWRIFRQSAVLLVRLFCLESGLHPWPGYLWSPLSDLEHCEIEERVRCEALALMPSDIVGLAEWYEALLALSPQAGRGGRTLHLEPTRGNPRKRWGSYSTPPRLMEPLLDAAGVGRIFNPSFCLCDPACGSGGLLLAAARRLAEEGFPLRDIVRHTLYGVDRDPLMVELCKLRLSRECAGEVSPGELNAHIRLGNSLVGAPLDEDVDNPDAWTAAVIESSRNLCERHGVFHWRAAFPEVFARGGFDVVIANPPWERVKHQRNEWACPSAGKEDRRRAVEETRFLRHSGRFPLSAHGDLNYYGPFIELCRQLLRTGGRAGLLLPSGIATDDSMKYLFQDLMRGELVSWYDFHNRARLFPGVQGNVKFGLLAIQRGATTATFTAAGQLSDPAELQQSGRVYTLTPERLALINPNTRHCPAFSSVQDVDLVARLHERFPILQRGGWAAQPATMFHMTNDAPLFATEKALRADGWTLDGNIFRKGCATRVPLYEAKLIKQYNHRAATFAGVSEAERRRLHPRTVPLQGADRCVLPRYWVDEEHVRTWAGNATWFLGFRNAISAVADARSLVAAIVPRAAVGNSLPLILGLDARRAALLLALLNSFVLDHVLRQKASGGNLNFHVLHQLPVPPPDEIERVCPDLVSRVVELTFTARDLAEFARQCGYHGPPRPFDVEQRWRTCCAIDAALFRLYGLSMREAEHVLDSFPVLARRERSLFGHFRSRSAILELLADPCPGGGGSLSFED